MKTVALIFRAVGSNPTPSAFEPKIREKALDWIVPNRGLFIFANRLLTHHISQRLVSKWWGEIHKSKIVDIRFVKLNRGKHKVAGYMAKHMSKESAGRYSWSWGWVWRGFCRHWTIYKRYWWRHFNTEGKTTFRNCLIGWKMWLYGIYDIDVDGMEADLSPPLEIEVK